MYRGLLVLAALLIICTRLVHAITNTSAQIEWVPTTDATIRYELRWSHFANGWKWEAVATNLDSTTGLYAQTYSAFPDTTGDRGVCWDARAVRGVLASPWLSESGQQACLQMPLASPVATSVPISTPTPPPPLPVLPEPAPIPGIAVESCDAMKIVVTAPVKDCARLVTSTKGSTKTMHRRTITCEK